ncbi:MAG: DsbA family protein [Solirubrobacteraceae bacterium]|nr:DsbA family protein [Solirubrobacteraceae bacterium]
MSDVVITEFTDPACPWAYSAEPFRRRLMWLYGDAIEWRLRMIVLAEDPQEYVDKGLTIEMLAAGAAMIARDHGMPIDTSPRSRMAATAPACRAVVAARLHAPAAERPILRAFRLRAMRGELLDEPSTVRGAAGDAGLDPDEVQRWSAGEDVERAMREDMHAARHPTPAALALDDRLASWSGGRRYTCPSYEIVRTSDGASLTVPGFQPFAAYDVALANLLPSADRRALPSSALEVLEWAGEPLATREVAVVRDVDHATAREQLGRVADEEHVGSDGLWSPK